MNKLPKFFLTAVIIFLSIYSISAQNKTSDSLFSEKTFDGLKFRNIGPALMSGRIADIAVHPEDKSLWYVAVGSGGVWKTENSGTTWKSIFDKEKSYSTGCVSIDPNNTNIIWVGTGENVGGRHVGFGDGVYKSLDAGENWENVGLKKSEHISEIIIHPENSNIVWVASQGPLWSKGGDRGLFKTIDGGKTWKLVLKDNEWTGVTDIAIDPRDADILYAATWQRHRNVASYMGGGPGSGIWRSDDGGDNWKKLKEGLPKSNMGKIGIAISPQKPDVIYAAIELERTTGGVYKSENRGESWTKQSNAVSGATGPHYYQELYASPHKFDMLYLVDVRMQVSEDGGKTFYRMKESYKHSDNHSINFDKDDPNYLLVGTDGGIYESFDNTKNWRFVANLPVTQFYKIAVDDKEPFYTVYGGTQDNSTQGGPSRTDNPQGISNRDWFLTLFADGHQPATEPGNPDIMYSEWQEGNLVRVDRTTGEIVHIQPQPGENENYERFNWDAPILISPHSPTRLYFASHRVWKSDNRGDSWKAISGDLTKNQERMNLPLMDKTWSWDSHWDFAAMSNYNTITSLAESPLMEGLIYAGTDDGLIQITENGGINWKMIEVASLPGVPSTAFVNDIKADLFDANTVYAALDNHKFGDFKPYLVKSTDKGKTWKSIKGNIPDRNLIWRIVQDYVNPQLLFVGTEFGIYFTVDGGNRWTKLTGNIPTISFRDLAIQKRENDLVAASFGRGIFILDDYSALRNLSEDNLNKEALLFPVRKAWWYIERPVVDFEKETSQGAALYTAPNPPFGAVFTYYLSEELKSKKDLRKENEDKLVKENKNVKFPGWSEVEAERREEKPSVWLTVKDNMGNVVRRIEGSTGKGFYRTSWDLRFPSSDAIDLKIKNFNNESKGRLAPPGEYTVTLSKEVEGIVTVISGPVKFIVERLYNGALPGAELKDVSAFLKNISDLERELTASRIVLTNAFKKIEGFEIALNRSSVNHGDLDLIIYNTKQNLYDLDEQLNGNKSKREIGQNEKPSIYNRLSKAKTGIEYSTYGPTETHKQLVEIAEKQLTDFNNKLNSIINIEFVKIEEQLNVAGAPFVK
ncbi:MAG: glycosyl hydrolase [Bacteroidetes bacterium]|nr:glycosyl hydrolase [Bacteroidota bacterium]